MTACSHFPEVDHPIMNSFKQAKLDAASAASESEAPSVRQKLQALTKNDLKELLVQRGLKVSGKKGELIDRLLEADPSFDLPGSPEQSTETASPLAAAATDTEVNNASPPQASSAPVATADEGEEADDTKSEAFQQMTIPKLKELLRKHELKVSGKKADLVNRCLANGLPIS
jgi:hypothetical protein